LSSGARQDIDPAYCGPRPSIGRDLRPLVFFTEDACSYVGVRTLSKSATTIDCANDRQLQKNEIY
jgi:hypothetical protein